MNSVLKIINREQWINPGRPSALINGIPRSALFNLLNLAFKFSGAIYLIGSTIVLDSLEASATRCCRLSPMHKLEAETAVRWIKRSDPQDDLFNLFNLAFKIYRRENPCSNRLQYGQPIRVRNLPCLTTNSACEFKKKIEIFIS